MFCHQCGEKMLDDARFCSSCGAEKVFRVDISKKTDEPAPIVHSPSKFSLILPILIPALSLILVVAGLTFYYFHEQEVNAEVLSLQKDAEEEALNQEYDKAIQLLEKALKQRPDYSLLQDNLDVIKRAKDYEKALAQISEKVKKTEFAEATKEINSLKEKLNKEQGPLFEPFHQLIADSEVKVTVGTIKKELNELTTIDELGGKLSILSTLPEKEASAVKQEILNKIVQISTDDVEKKLTNKQFSEAFATIDKGLQFAEDNEKLVALKSRVEQDKAAFEKAEQQRIEKAMEAAAQEDLKNRTAAVEVSHLSYVVDEFGDLYVSGVVTNVATQSISSINIYYSIYDENYIYIGEGYASVYPYSLNPGEQGSFEDLYFGVYQDVNIEINNITWYLY